MRELILSRCIFISEWTEL